MTFAMPPMQYIDKIEASWLDSRLNRPRSDPHVNVASSSFDPPRVVFDERSGSAYEVKQLLGKGGFAYCYLATIDRQQEFALKIVARASMRRRTDDQKIYREVCIHQALRHPNIVAFYKFFADDENMYMLLEYCPQNTLLHHIDASPGRSLREPDAIVLLKQLLRAVKYLHEECGLLHRDIKPGNILLSREWTVKLADFGFALPIKEINPAALHNVCGTPNYVAPEILEKRGPSVYSEYWAVGCTFYCMLYGRPPFESECVDTTYERIKRCQFVFPEYSNVSSKAQEFIARILVRPRKRRTDIDSMLADPVFSPYNRSLSHGSGLNSRVELARSPAATSRHRATAFSPKRHMELYKTNALGDSGLGSDVSGNLSRFLRNTLEYYCQTVRRVLDVANDTSLCPIESDLPPSFVAKWVDYTQKYGFGATLKDGTRTMVLTDQSTLSASGDRIHFAYRHRRFCEECVEWEYGEVPNKKLVEKLTLLEHLRNYMDKHLYSLIDIDDWEFRRRFQRGDTEQLTYIVDFWKFPNALLVFLSDGSCQVNFCESHVKILMRRTSTGEVKIYIVGAEQQVSCYVVKTAVGGGANSLSSTVCDSLFLRLVDFRVVVDEYLAFFGRNQPVISTDC